MGTNSYNRIAFLYDTLSWLLGPSYRKSKYVFLANIKSGDRILYLGGGTGVNLPEIAAKVGKEGRVVYVDSSSRMIEKAKKRMPPELSSQIQYLNQSDFCQLPREKFNFVLTQYFLDNLPDQEISRLFEAIDSRSLRNSQWIFVDFFEVKHKKCLLEMMIFLFHIFNLNPRKNLPNYSLHFGIYGWKITQKESFDKGFIQAWHLVKDSGLEK